MDKLVARNPLDFSLITTSTEFSETTKSCRFEAPDQFIWLDIIVSNFNMIEETLSKAGGRALGAVILKIPSYKLKDVGFRPIVNCIIHVLYLYKTTVLVLEFQNV